MGNNEKNMMILDPFRDIHILKGLASEIRIKILVNLQGGSKNINEIASTLNLPQSTVATNVQVLEKCGLIRSHMTRASKGNQKICQGVCTEFLLSFQDKTSRREDCITVEMPIGLYIQSDVSPPCGLCSSNAIIAYLDSPEAFLEPARVKAGLLWFEKGLVKYQFPNNAFNTGKAIRRLELSLELSSETPGTNPNWPSDISLCINAIETGVWTSPGDFGDKRGTYTPEWWKLEGSQYGILTHWAVTETGCYVNGRKISDVTIHDLSLQEHHSIKVSLGVKEDAVHRGGMNLFGRGFGNYDQGIILKLFVP